MQPKATIGVLYYSELLVVMFGSICGDPLRSNGGKQLIHERIKGRSTYSGGSNVEDRWPVAVPVCTEDEYYDVNVQACSRCSDICRPNIDLTFCASKCLEYFHVHFDSSNHPEVRRLSFAVTALISSSAGAREEERLTEKPLFWTSIVSMTIAVAATAAIIALCVRRRKPRRSLVERMESNENSRPRTFSETSDDREPEHRTLLHNTGGGSSAPAANCIEERRGMMMDESNNRSMFITGGGQTTTTTERFGSGVFHQKDHSDLPVIPSPDRGRYPSPQRVLHSNPPAYNINSTNFNQSPTKVDIWALEKQNGNVWSPSFTMPLFTESKRQLETNSGPLTMTFLSTSPTVYSEGRSYALPMHGVSQTRGKRLSYLEDEDDTYVKEERFIDSQGSPHPRLQDDISLEPKIMGIQMSNGSLVDDIRRLQISVRLTTEIHTNPGDHDCEKTKRTPCGSPPAYDDRISTDEPNLKDNSHP